MTIYFEKNLARSTSNKNLVQIKIILTSSQFTPNITSIETENTQICVISFFLHYFKLKTEVIIN